VVTEGWYHSRRATTKYYDLRAFWMVPTHFLYTLFEYWSGSTVVAVSPLNSENIFVKPLWNCQSSQIEGCYPYYGATGEISNIENRNLKSSSKRQTSPTQNNARTNFCRLLYRWFNIRGEESVKREGRETTNIHLHSRDKWLCKWKSCRHCEQRTVVKKWRRATWIKLEFSAVNSQRKRV
jgi:hypothetical protein